jgi:hypothetical protein
LKLTSVGEFRKTRHPRNVEFNEVLEICFSGARHMRFSGILGLWSFGVANMRLSGISNLRSLGVMNLRKAGISNQRSHELQRAEIRESARSLFRKSQTGNSRTGEKQSQSCRPKKSGFEVWTSGRLVNIWDEKDILICVHIRNILRARGCFRNVKVPSSPYKRGREGTCKDTHCSWKLEHSVGDSRSPLASLLRLNRAVHEFFWPWCKTQVEAYIYNMQLIKCI